MWKSARALLPLAMWICALRQCGCTIMWYKSAEYRSDWEPYMRRSNMKSQCLKLYDRALDAGHYGRVQFVGPGWKQIAAHVVAIRWYCTAACRATCGDFRRRPGRVKWYNEPVEVAVAHATVVCWCQAVNKYNRRGKPIMHGWGRCKPNDVGAWQPKRNAAGKPMSSFKESRKLGRWRESRHAANRRRRGPSGAWAKRGHSLGRIYRWYSPCAQPGGGGQTKATATGRPHTKPTRTVVVTMPTWKDKTTTTSVGWTWRPHQSTTMSAVWTMRPRTTTEETVSSTGFKVCKTCAKDTDKDFGIDVYPGNETDREWFLHWTKFDTRPIAGYLIAIKLRTGSTKRYFHYFSPAATTTALRIMNVPKRANVKLVVKPLGDTVTLNATTRADYSGVTRRTFEYRAPAFLLLPALRMHDIAAHGSVSAQLVYHGKRKDAAGVPLHARARGGRKLTGRFDGAFKPRANGRTSVLVRMQFPVAELQQGFLSSCGVRPSDMEHATAAKCPGFKFTCADSTATTCGVADVRLEPIGGHCALPAAAHRSRT